MKRPASIGGRPLPKGATSRDSGRGSRRCALCGQSLGDPRDASVTLVYARPPAGKAAFKTVCRQREECQARQRKAMP